MGLRNRTHTHTTDGVVVITSGRRKVFVAPLAGTLARLRILGKGWNPVLGMGPCIVHQNVGLGLGRLITTGAGKLHVQIRILRLLLEFRMGGCQMLEIRRLLYKMLRLFTMRASKLEILGMVLLHMVIHGILLLTGLVAMGANIMTCVILHVLYSGGHLEGKRRERRRFNFMKWGHLPPIPCPSFNFSRNPRNHWI